MSEDFDDLGNPDENLDCCQHESMEEVELASFFYQGEAISFEVTDVTLKRCVKCGNRFYMAIQAREWSVAKAREVLERGGPYLGNEVKFLRQTTRLTLEDLAKKLGEPREQVIAWEKTGIQVPEDVWAFARTVEPLITEYAQRVSGSMKRLN